jgi:hypothetical protein
MHRVKIKAIRSDNGGEFIFPILSSIIWLPLALHEISAFYKQEQNRVAERVNRTIVWRAMAILYGAQLPIGSVPKRPGLHSESLR